MRQKGAILADERHTLQVNDPSNPKISELNEHIQTLVSDYRKKKWHDHLDSASFNGGTNSLS